MNQVQERKKIMQQIKQHKKAVLYSFFHTLQDLTITNLEPEMQKDRTRIVVSFGQQNKVIYDTGSLELELGFVKFITWFNQNILKDRKMYCKRILSYPDCGFVEYISTSVCQNENKKKEYYYRLGSLDALLLLLQNEKLTIFDVKMIEDQPIIPDIRTLLKKKPVYNQNWLDETKKRQHTHKSIANEYLESMEKGYEDTCSFIKKNEDDIKAIIKLCFH